MMAYDSFFQDPLPYGKRCGNNLASKCGSSNESDFALYGLFLTFSICSPVLRSFIEVERTGYINCVDGYNKHVYYIFYWKLSTISNQHVICAFWHTCKVGMYCLLIHKWPNSFSLGYVSII